MAENRFDSVIERKNTNSLKYDFAVERGRPADVLPLWVADMDFPTAEPILEALRKSVDHGIFGYSDTKSDYYEAAASWFQSRFDWRPKESWLVKTPGVVYALATAVKALTRPGDGVLIQTPVYYPFYEVIRDNGRKIVENPLVYSEGRYALDLADFEEKIVQNGVKLFLLCSPHNPVGIVWNARELQAMGEICRRHDVYVAADEIHCDFAFQEHPHTMFLKAVPELFHRTICCTAPSKTFNLAGLQVSNIWIPDEQVRKKFQKEIDKTGYSQLNTLGLVACQAAYRTGGEWLDECRAYLRENLDFMRDYLEQRLPELKLVEPMGTYFAWVDCSGLGLGPEELEHLILHEAKLWLDSGRIFGEASAQFQRFVLACPRATLERALNQLERAVGRRKQGEKL